MGPESSLAQDKGRIKRRRSIHIFWIENVGVLESRREEKGLFFKILIGAMSSKRREGKFVFLVKQDIHRQFVIN